MSSTGNLGESAAPGEKRKRDDVEEEAIIGGYDGPSDERPAEKAARLAGEDETTQAQSSSSDSEDGGVAVGGETQQGESAATGEEESTVPAVEETQQEQSAAAGDEENNVPESEENAQPSLGIQPFPRTTAAAAAFHVSPTPSNTSPWPAGDVSETVSTATSPELARPPRPGREDNSAADAALRRGPLDPFVHPEDSKKGALVHTALTLMRLELAGLIVEEQQMRQLATIVWPAAVINQMKTYLIGGHDAMPSPVELHRYARALRARPRQPEDQHKEGGLVHAAYTIIRLNAAEQQAAAGQIRQHSALIWSEPDVQDMVSFLYRIGKGVLSAKEERRFDDVRFGAQQPMSDDDSEFDPEEGAEAEVE